MQNRFPLTVTELGVSATINPTRQIKNGREYFSYQITYSLLGARKRETRSNFEEAKKAAVEACKRIALGEQQVLELRNNDRLVYVRATEALGSLDVPLDVACREYAEARAILGSDGTIAEAVRVFLKQRAGVIDKRVPDAVAELLLQIETEQKNIRNGTRRKEAWLKLLTTHLKGKLARDFQCNVSDLSSVLLEPWLISIRGSERTHRNIRDCVAYFVKWAKGRSYLSREADPLAHVQQFRKRKRGAVKIISSDDLTKLLAFSPPDFIPYLALRSFAGLRDCEARALDWQHLDLEGGWIDIPDHVAKQADDDEGVARMVKIRPILAEWLRPLAKKSGPLCPYANSVKQLGKVAKRAGVKIPRNALRHSFISAAVTLNNDLNAVSIEAGNSVPVIRNHYWRKMRPEQAEAWFGVSRDTVSKILLLNQELSAAA